MSDLGRIFGPVEEFNGSIATLVHPGVIFHVGNATDPDGPGLTFRVLGREHHRYLVRCRRLNWLGKLVFARKTKPCT